MNGYDQTSSVISLAKSLLQLCDGEPDRVIVEKAQLKLVLEIFIKHWMVDQDKKREGFTKVANG